jgi:hypothetical protein
MIIPRALLTRLTEAACFPTRKGQSPAKCAGSFSMPINRSNFTRLANQYRLTVCMMTSFPLSSRLKKCFNTVFSPVRSL